MSEIYNGTFLLGNTSATTLSAGEGIKIDSTSVPGTIKISNDETVLWSGAEQVTNRETLITLNENLFNFEKIQIWDDWLNNSPTKITEFSTSGQAGGTTFQRFGTLHCAPDGWQFEQNPQFYLAWNFYSVQDNGNKIRTERNYIAGALTGGSQIPALQQRNASYVYKIVGVNRISGGN